MIKTSDNCVFSKADLRAMSLGLPCLIKKEDFSKKLRQIASCLIFFSVKCQNSAGSALDCLDLIYWLRTLLLWSITFYIFLKNQKGSDIFWESLKNSKNLLYNCWQNTKVSAELLCCDWLYWVDQSGWQTELTGTLLHFGLPAYLGLSCTTKLSICL